MKGRLVWVSTINPFETLDVATWLNTTEELTAQGWDVTLIGFGPQGVHKVSGVEVTCIPWPETYFLGQFLYHFRALGLIFREFTKTDVVLFHQISALWMLPLILLRWLSRKSHPKFVMDTRDLMDITSLSIKARLRMWFYDVVYWLAPHVFDGQTTITPRMAELVNIPSKQLWGIWPSGVEIERYQGAVENRIWPVEDAPIHLMYIGILLEKRNSGPLAQAVIRANQEGMRFRLTFIGNGPERTKLERIAAESQAAIQVLEPVRHEQIATCLADAHVGVTSLPAPDDAKYEASSPIKLFEYMAAGLPILATTNACHTNVVGNGDYAFWAESANEEAILGALRSLWDKRNELAQLGSSSLENASGWSWHAAGRKLSDALSQSLSQSNPSATTSRSVADAINDSVIHRN